LEKEKALEKEKEKEKEKKKEKEEKRTKERGLLDASDLLDCGLREGLREGSGHKVKEETARVREGANLRRGCCEREGERRRKEGREEEFDPSQSPFQTLPSLETSSRRPSCDRPFSNPS